MELKELIERVVEQSKDERVKAGTKVIVNTLMADIEDWPAWYYQLFEDERKYDFSGKSPTALQKLNLGAVKGAVIGLVQEYAKEFKAKRNKVVPIDLVATTIAERVVYWEDWYWDVAEAWDIQSDLEEEEARFEVYSTEYGEETRYGT